MPKRHVFAPTADRWVSVEDGVVRDLDGQMLGEIRRESDSPSPHLRNCWSYKPAGSAFRYCPFRTQRDAVAALLVSPLCPTPGPNRYDRPAR